MLDEDDDECTHPAEFLEQARRYVGYETHVVEVVGIAEDGTLYVEIGDETHDEYDTADGIPEDQLWDTIRCRACGKTWDKWYSADIVQKDALERAKQRLHEMPQKIF